MLVPLHRYRSSSNVTRNRARALTIGRRKKKPEEDENAEDGKKGTLSLHRNLSYNLLKAEIVKSLSITRFTRVHGLFNERNFMFSNTQLFHRRKYLCECRSHDWNGWRSKTNATTDRNIVAILVSHFL